MTTHVRARRGQTTSAQAAAEEERRGTFGRQAAEALALVRLHPGSTSFELAKCPASTLDRYVLGRRLPELEREGAVVKGESRKCAVTGHMAVTWWPREGQAVLL